MKEALKTEPEATEDFRLTEAAREERGYMLRFVLIALVFTAASWIYTAQSAGRINTPAVEKLDRFEELNFQEKSVVLREAFSDLSVPSFYGGPRVPESLLPEGEPYVQNLSEKELVDRFIAKDAFSLLPQHEAASMPQEHVKAEKTRRSILYSKIRRKALSPKDIEASKGHAPLFANYLSLELRNYPIHSVTDDEIKLCQSYTPCLSGALGRRHPSHQGTLKVLYHYANQRPFTKKSEKFMGRRLGFFTRARHILIERGIPPSSKQAIAQINRETSATGTDVAILKLLRLHQWEALHRSQVMSIFLSVITGLLTLLFWRNRRLT